MQPVESQRPVEPAAPGRPVEYATPARPVEYAAPARPVVSTTAVSPMNTVAQIIYIVFGILEGLIAIRFVLKLLGANPDAGFSSFVYSITDPFLAPFQGVFGTPVVHTSVFEFTSILAIIVYALVAWGLASLMFAIGRRQTTVTT